MTPDLAALPDTLTLFARFGAALAIGLLAGMQREYANRVEADEPELFAGTRTFALLGLLGCVGGLLSDLLGTPLAFLAIFLTLAAFVTVAYFLEGRRGHVGITTEVAALMVVLTGVLCYAGLLALAAALGVATTVLLSLKVRTQSLAKKISKEDIHATLTFAVISVIILPVLPREGYGPPPFDVLVPYKIWLMVVFISGISYVGYILMQFIGARRGVGLTGILGGLASSTAVTLTFASRSREAAGLARPLALGILLAWSIMFVRVIVEVAVVNAALLAAVWLPITAALAVCLAYCGYLYFRERHDEDPEPTDFRNPFELGPALTFGLLYAVILLAANAAKMYFGDAGIYLSSIASGLADVDAITLSMAELSKGDLDHGTAARAIVLAAVSNTVVKGGIVLTTAAAALRKAILPGLVITLAAALAVAFVL